MTHGLTDSPYAMRDLAGFFSRQGFYVLAMQLPGHGTRPGDLLAVGWRDWARSQRHLLTLLCAGYEEVYLCGFSAGATLSLYTALLEPRVRGLFLFAPALRMPALAWLANPLAHLGRCWRPLAWFDVQPDSDCFKYESLPQRAIAEVWQLRQALARLEPLNPRALPLFVVASEQDATLNAPAILTWFHRQNGPKQMLYYSRRRPPVPAGVKRIASHFPQQRIRSFAHTSLIQSPANPHYGAQGAQRVCAHYYRMDPARYQRCKAGEEDCLGEIFDETQACRVIRRLTYNPLFEEMLEEMRAFMARAIGD